MTDFPHPVAPTTLEATGLSLEFLVGLASKLMKHNGVMSISELSDAIHLTHPVVRLLAEEMVRLQVIEARGLALQSEFRSDLRFSLTERGDRWAADALAISQYAGPAPVPLKSFIEQVEHQRIASEVVGREQLEAALSHLIIPDDLRERLGPAVNSAASVLLYGEAGNGKTSIAEALATTFEDTILFPHAFLVRNEIIQIFDETVHVRAGDLVDAEKFDRRWVRCSRPIIRAGGELSLEKLDLVFEPMARFYEAPMHLKALGGMFLIDDFGRQKEPPKAFINRWIGPLERGFDILTLHTGKKFVVPFDLLLLLSTNMRVLDISDNAGLRRIFFKIHVPSPTKAEYLEIFRRACGRVGIAYVPQVIEQFYDDIYQSQNLVASGAHPGFLLKHIRAASAFYGKQPELTRDLLEMAWQNVVSDARNDGVKADAAG